MIRFAQPKPGKAMWLFATWVWFAAAGWTSGAASVARGGEAAALQNN